MAYGGESKETRLGCLVCDFELFHLKDRRSIQFEPHYHDFNKIVIFISGNVTYQIEGRAYRLSPWDILLVGNHEVHKPAIGIGADYERVILWVNEAFLERHRTEDSDLCACFELASKTHNNLLRPDPEFSRFLGSLLAELEKEHKGGEFGSRILENSLFLQLMVLLNREFLGKYAFSDTKDIESDQTIDSLLEYINGNLNADLSVESLSSRFFVSRYHLMHKFKLLTGYSIHSYILHKRLKKANELLKSVRQISEVSSMSGFSDYSSFVRAFKKIYGLSPREHRKNMQIAEKEYLKGRHS